MENQLSYETIFDKDPANEIQLKNSLGAGVQKNLTIQFIVKKLQSFPDFLTLRNDPELLLFIANILKELESNNKIKGNFTSLEIDKKELIVSAYTKVFNLNAGEIDALKKQYEFLEKHHKITGIKISKKVFSFVKEAFFWLLKRL